MKIGVVSDTHLREPDAEFRRAVQFHFRDVEKILHAGDFVGWAMAEYLAGVKELIAVCGNMDSIEIGRAFPRKRVLGLDRFKVGLIHGGGSPFGIESRIRAEFEEVDAIVYGHTHIAVDHRVKGIHFFNPGSPTRSYEGSRTLGILHLGEKIEGEIINL